MPTKDEVCHLLTAGFIQICALPYSLFRGPPLILHFIAGQLIMWTLIRSIRQRHASDGIEDAYQRMWS